MVDVLRKRQEEIAEENAFAQSLYLMLKEINTFAPSAPVRVKIRSEPPPPGHTYCEYVVGRVRSTTRLDADHFNIFSVGLAAFVMTICQTFGHQILEPDDCIQTQHLSLEEALVYLAFEVTRHRFQEYHPEAMISRVHTERVPRFRRFGQLVEMHVMTDENEPNKAREFDSTIICALAAYEHRRNRLEEKEYVKTLITMTPEQFLKIDS